MSAMRSGDRRPGRRGRQFGPLPALGLSPLLVVLVGLPGGGPRLAAAEDCLCKQYRCRLEEKEYVYTLADFKGPEIQRCLSNNTKAFNIAGDCLYGCYDCQDDICDCKEALQCDTIMTAGAVFCFIAAALSCLCALNTARKYFTKHYIMDEEQAEEYEREKMDISSKLGHRAVPSCFACMALVFTGLGISFILFRQFFA